MSAFTWISELFTWIADWVPHWIQVDVNENAVKHSGWKVRRAQCLRPGIRWYWPAFSQIEGPFRTVWQPLTTSTINVMDKDGHPVAARGFAVWRITDVIRFAVEHDEAADMLDDLVCAAIREVIRAKSVSEIQENSRNTTDNGLKRELEELTGDLGVEIQLVRLTTFTKARMLCVMGDDAPTIVDDEESE